MSLNVYDLSKSQSMSVIMCDWSQHPLLLCSSQPLDYWVLRWPMTSHSFGGFSVDSSSDHYMWWYINCLYMERGRERYSKSIYIYNIYIYICIWREMWREIWREIWTIVSKNLLSIVVKAVLNLSPDFLSRDASPESLRDNLWERSLTVGYGGYGKQHGHRI